MLPSISTYVVEAVRTARRYLSAAGLKGHVQDLEFHELNEHTTPEEVEALMKLFDDGRDVGLITEAGLPAARGLSQHRLQKRQLARRGLV